MFLDMGLNAETEEEGEEVGEEVVEADLAFFRGLYL